MGNLYDFLFINLSDSERGWWWVYNQTNWTINLIKFKEGRNDTNIQATSIKNAIKYLTNPEFNLTMLSDRHRKMVFENILSTKYAGIQSTILLMDFFKRIGIFCVNPKNNGALYSWILYLPFIKPLWLDDRAQDQYNQLTDIGFEDADISRASKLIFDNQSTKSKVLDLGNCGLTDLSIIPELFECIHLEELILSNEWTNFDNGKWNKTTSQNKGKKNLLEYLPDQIKNLNKLKRLTCGGDWNDSKSIWNRWGIKSITPILRLNELEHLNLSNNLITNITGLNQLKKLRNIHLNNNSISKTTPLGDLVELEEINLSNNRIKNVSFLKDLVNIATIDLHNNNIKDISPLEEIIGKIGIENSKWKLNTINIAKNSLELPPIEIVNLGKEAVLTNLRDIRTGGSYINKEIKVILVGNSEVGKSTLVKYLNNEIDLDKPHPSTHWMAEKIVKSKYKIETIGEECTLHLFDFGGHDFYHDTHQLFYSPNTLYILLWDSLTNHLNLRETRQKNNNGEGIIIQTQDYPIKYWLESVKHYIKDVEAENFEFEVLRDKTYNSPLLLIQNKVGRSDLVNHLNNEALIIKYPFIYDFLNISIIDPRRNLVALDAVLTEMLNNISIIGAKLPKYYQIVKDGVISYAGKPVLTLPEFLNYCNTLIKDKIDLKQCNILGLYLEQIGILLYSKQSDNSKVYVDKKKIIDSIHIVLEELSKKAGEFDLNDVKSTIAGNDKDAIDAENVIEIMLDFQIIFKHPYENKYIAPLYLPIMPANTISLFLNKLNLPFRRIEYPGFIHKHVVLSFFKEYGRLITGDKPGIETSAYYFWKDGLIIKDPFTAEIVMIKFHLGNTDGNAYIDIFQLGEKGNDIFVNQIINHLKEINKNYQVEEMVTLNGIDFISLEVLSDNAKNGKLVFSEQRLNDRQKPKALKEVYFKLKDYHMFLKEEIKKKRVVISYSKEDLVQVHVLKRYLQPLVDSELIDQPWYCSGLFPGDDWDTEIKSHFDEADIIFFMVSEHFFNTKYIVEREIRNAIDRYDNGKSVKIIPIILEFYDWAGKAPYNLQRFSALPYRAKPISDFRNPKQAWSTITSSVKMMIEKDLDPAKIELVNKDLQEIYERQVSGKLNNDS